MRKPRVFATSSDLRAASCVSLGEVGGAAQHPPRHTSSPPASYPVAVGLGPRPWRAEVFELVRGLHIACEVREVWTGEPVAGAQVLDGRNVVLLTESDEHGAVAVDVFETDSRDIWIQAEGYVHILWSRDGPPGSFVHLARGLVTQSMGSEFRVPIVPCGLLYSLRVRADGYSEFTRALPVVHPGENPQVRVVLVPDSGDR